MSCYKHNEFILNIDYSFTIFYFTINSSVLGMRGYRIRPLRAAWVPLSEALVSVAAVSSGM